MIQYSNRLDSIVKSLRSSAYPTSKLAVQADRQSDGLRFITISRQAGAGGKHLAAQLTEAINRLQPQANLWCAWDKELVGKVSAEHHIPDRFIEEMEDEKHPWFAEFLAGLGGGDHPDEFKVYRRVAMTIRALAVTGRAVIVGRGGVFITAGLTGGLHLMLVAPVQTRVRRMAERLGIPEDQAAVKVHAIDHNRQAFYHRYWPGKAMSPETFAMTLNTAELSDAQMVSVLLPLMTGQAGPREHLLTSSQKAGVEHGGAW